MYRSIITIESSRIYVWPTNLRRKIDPERRYDLANKKPNMTGVMRALDGASER